MRYLEILAKIQEVVQFFRVAFKIIKQMITGMTASARVIKRRNQLGIDNRKNPSITI